MAGNPYSKATRRFDARFTSYIIWFAFLAISAAVSPSVLHAQNNSSVRLQLLARHPDGGVVLSWNSETNAFATNFYRLMGATNAAGPFAPLASIPAFAPYSSATDYTFSASSRTFYRVQASNAFTTLNQSKAWTAYDAGSTAGLSTKGYVGGVFDGRYLYFVPSQDVINGNVQTNHGRVLRYDTEADFLNTTSWSAFDAGNVSGLLTIGFEGGVFDGRYVYFSPTTTGPAAGHVLRFDTTGTFTNFASWSAFDASHVDGLATYGFQGAVFDGHYVYFVAHFNTAFDGIMLRYDTQGPFSSASSWHAYDAGNTSGLLTKGYSSGVFDGHRFIYFVPVFDGATTHGRVLRFDTSGSFTNTASWLAFDAGNVTSVSNTTGFKGGVFDGRYVYLVPFSGSGRMLRYDTAGTFSSAASWQGYDAGNTGGNDTTGYTGGAFDGRYVWFSPYFNGSGPQGFALRYDTQGSFTNAASWQSYNASSTSGLTAQGFQSASFDGRYIYFIPYRSASFDGVVLRFDALWPRQLSGTAAGGSSF